MSVAIAPPPLIKFIACRGLLMPLVALVAVTSLVVLWWSSRDGPLDCLLCDVAAALGVCDRCGGLAAAVSQNRNSIGTTSSSCAS